MFLFLSLILLLLEENSVLCKDTTAAALFLLIFNCIIITSSWLARLRVLRLKEADLLCQTSARSHVLQQALQVPVLAEEGVLDREGPNIEEADARAAGRRAEGEANLGDQLGEEGLRFVDHLHLQGKVRRLEVDGAEGVDVRFWWWREEGVF